MDFIVLPGRRRRESELIILGADSQNSFTYETYPTTFVNDILRSGATFIVDFSIDREYKNADRSTEII